MISNLIKNITSSTSQSTITLYFLFCLFRVLILLQQSLLHYYTSLNSIFVFLLFFLLLLPNHKYQLLLACFRQGRRCFRRKRWLHSLVVLAQKILVYQVGAVFTTTFITDIHGKAKLKVQSTDLTYVFFLATALADAGSFKYAFITFPFKDSEGTKADPAFLSEVFLQHSKKGVLSITTITGEREV